MTLKSQSDFVFQLKCNTSYELNAFHQFEVNDSF
jgi:hypothetical protein